MEMTKNRVVPTHLGVIGVPALGCSARPWAAYVSGVHIAPTSVSVLKQDSAVMALPVDTTPRKDVFARSGIRTEGPPV